MSDAVHQLAELFVRARRAVAFTGAGVSTDSGIGSRAKHGRATLAIVNLEPTPLDAQADLVIRDRAGDAMARVVEKVGARLFRAPERQPVP